MVVVDTDFLSSFFKIGKLKLILKVLDISHITIPSTVYDELKNTKFFDEIAPFSVFKKERLDNNRFILVVNVNPCEWEGQFKDEKSRYLGDGELGCLLLAKKNNDTILIDDRQARRIAREKGIRATSIPAFLLYGKKKKILPISEIRKICSDLKQRDFYEFNEEIKEALLK